MPHSLSPTAHDHAAAAADVATDQQFLHDVLWGLSQPDKRLHCKYFYDQRGSQLFDQICELDAYYPTRTEAGILSQRAGEMGRHIGPHAVIVEYGSGSSTKTRLLLDQLQQPRAYLPVDISEEHLLQTAARLQQDYEHLDVHPIVADFTSGFDVPEPYCQAPLTVYFPGSTIGNLEPREALRLLTQIAEQCGPQGGLLIGIDLLKDERVLLRAYDDEHGVTAAFNLNLLHRINRELDGDFDVEQFSHVAHLNHDKSRIEIYIESRTAQRVRVGDQHFEFAAGERILTEYSHKYRIDDFRAMALQAELQVQAVWTDPNDYFAVLHLEAV